MTNTDLPSSRRSFMAGLAAATLTACGNTRQPTISTAVKVLADAFRDRLYTTADVERAPYASIGVRVDGGPEALVALATATHNQYTWIGEDHSLLTTEGGRLTRLIWRGIDARTQSGQGVDPVVASQLLALTPDKPALDCMRIVDFPRQNLYGIILKSQITAMGPATVDLLYGQAPALRFVDSGSAPTLDWAFENEFLMDPQTGMMWASRQQMAPWLPEFAIRVLRPATPTPA